MAELLPCDGCPYIQPCDENLEKAVLQKDKDVTIAARSLVQAIARKGECTGPKLDAQWEDDDFTLCDNTNSSEMGLVVENHVIYL